MLAIRADPRVLNVTDATCPYHLRGVMLWTMWKEDDVELSITDGTAFCSVAKTFIFVVEPWDCKISCKEDSSLMSFRDAVTWLLRPSKLYILTSSASFAIYSSHDVGMKMFLFRRSFLFFSRRKVSLEFETKVVELMIKELTLSVYMILYLDVGWRRAPLMEGKIETQLSEERRQAHLLCLQTPIKHLQMKFTNQRASNKTPECRERFPPIPGIIFSYDQLCIPFPRFTHLSSPPLSQFGPRSIKLNNARRTPTVNEMRIPLSLCWHFPPSQILSILRFFYVQRERRVRG